MEAIAGPSSQDTKKPMIDQICEAIKVLGKPRIGASVVAIKKHVLESYEESQHGRVGAQFKKAISKGEESGLLVRPVKCKNSVGATGSFLLKIEKLKTEIDKPQKQPDDKTKKMKKLFSSEDKVKIPTKPKATKVKKEEKKDNSNSENFNCSTPKSTGSGVEQKIFKPRALLKKNVKGPKNDNTFTMKKYSSDSELTDVKQKTAKRKNLKEKPKTTKTSKPGSSHNLKETEKALPLKEKKTRKVLKSYNSDSVLA